MGKGTKPLKQRNNPASQHDEIMAKEAEHFQNKRQNDTFESLDSRSEYHQNPRT